MEAQMFPGLSDNVRSSLRGFYSLEEHPTQDLMDSWAAALDLDGTVVARWVKWKRAMADTLRSKSGPSQASPSAGAVAAKHEHSPSPISPHGAGPPYAAAVAGPSSAPPSQRRPSSSGNAYASTSSSVGPPAPPPALLPRPQHQVRVAYTPLPPSAPPSASSQRPPAPRTGSQPGPGPGMGYFLPPRPQSATAPNPPYYYPVIPPGMPPPPPRASLIVFLQSHNRNLHDYDSRPSLQ
ncbi:hypothetical protein EXIGLDRAFT_837830 [Exidia glandulosa HHB12029]|uniref:Uncharacterized protein n=1 Tax=Exidia glandulosa HHB12029 TaxID=1314781 RepID=A0A166ABN6_EXIGL|nr:hypothetical protein EXIGLDRAFT_837830 [Exidia glandulosa HHB12029]